MHKQKSKSRRLHSGVWSRISKRATALAVGFASVTLLAPATSAQDATTTGSALTVPVFESIDENGVDLTTGMLRLRSPVLSVGTGVLFGLEWTGQSWRFIGIPTISRDGDTYFVSYEGSTEEFKGRSNGFAQKKPLSGASLNCSIFDPGNFASWCEYTSRFGEIVMFQGQPTPNTPTPAFYGMQTMGMGNLGMNKATVYSGARPEPVFGAPVLGGGIDQSFFARDNYLSVGNQELKVTTPNQDGTDTNQTWLRPMSTTQTITDASGSVWNYTVNSDREITIFQPPGGLASVTYQYNSSHRVTSVTSSAGTWSYSYSSPGYYRLVTVQTPTGRQYSVKSHQDYGYVVEYRENPGLSNERLTKYDYDAGHRLIRITQPELNRIEFLHDVRGNVTQQSLYPKPISSEPVLTTTANYSATCTNRVLCNRPNYVIDPNGNRTDFEYAPPATAQITIPNQSPYTTETRDWGHGQPVKIIRPAALSGSPRSIVVNSYAYGQLAETRNCITVENCTGTVDEVVTTYQYRLVPYLADLHSRTFASDNYPLHQGNLAVPYSQTVTADGKTLRTCFEYDQEGRLVGQTPPRPGLTSCPTDLSAPPAYDATAPTPNYLRAAPSFSQ